MRKVQIGNIILFFIIVSIFFSCSPKINRKLLTFFFDGVPKSESDSLNSINENGKAEVSSVISDTTLVVRIKDELCYHDPYKENDCKSCHDINSITEIIKPEPGLCYNCHDDFRSKYKVIHGPAAGGYCTSCHSPHMTKTAKLLIRTGQQLCLYCHDHKMIMENEMHSDIGDADCTTCHNPHGGDDKYLIN
jgi:predicted CXXCH cytochrome family protein